MFGGLSIFTSKPFVIGDTITVKGIVGDVESVGIRYTRLRDPDGRVITIPNGQVAQDIITSVSSERAKRIQLTLGITYNPPARKLDEAMRIVREIVMSRPKTGHEEFTSVFKNYNTSSIGLWFVYFVLERKNSWPVVSEINLRIKKRFEKEGIEFAFPAQTLYIEKLPQPNGEKKQRRGIGAQLVR